MFTMRSPTRKPSFFACPPDNLTYEMKTSPDFCLRVIPICISCSNLISIAVSPFRIICEREPSEGFRRRREPPRDRDPMFIGVFARDAAASCFSFCAVTRSINLDRDIDPVGVPFSRLNCDMDPPDVALRSRDRDIDDAGVREACLDCDSDIDAVDPGEKQITSLSAGNFNKALSGCCLVDGCRQRDSRSGPSVEHAPNFRSSDQKYQTFEKKRQPI